MTTDVLNSNVAEVAISLQGKYKTYKHFELKNVSFEMEQGTVAGLVWPKGAGKCTCMRIMLGSVQPEKGVVSVLGQKSSSTEA